MTETLPADPAATLPADFGRTWVTLICSTLTEAAPALGELDRRSGDGDFGTNVQTAMKLAAENFEAAAPGTYTEWLTCLYRAYLGVGGTSGPLFGMIFRCFAQAAQGSAEPTLAAFSAALTNSIATVQRYGDAKVGDKTMVDGLAPAAAALEQALEEATGEATEEATEQATIADAAPAALAQAAAAGHAGAAATATYVARRGRSSYVGDVSLGVMDPGACQVALILAAASIAAGHQVPGTSARVDLDWLTSD